ncbi:MAG: hypothetical protein V1886_02455 [archaeon]
MFEEKVKEKIVSFVSLQARSIDEIAKHIGRNWRTANRYVDRIAAEGIIAVKVFREGTRGALKIAYLTALTPRFSIFQNELYDKIKLGRVKSDFSPFDIWQYVKGRKEAFLEQQEDESKLALNKDLFELLKSAKKEVLIFSGNLSWANLEVGKAKIIDMFEELAKRKVSISIITRVDFPALANIKKVMSINHKLGKEVIKIKHREQPLRAVIVDDKIARLKEIKDPKDYRKGELEKKTYIFYNIYDKEWVGWLKKVFWDMFFASIDAGKRLSEIEGVTRLG